MGFTRQQRSKRAAVVFDKTLSRPSVLLLSRRSHNMDIAHMIVWIESAYFLNPATSAG
jgi:hypothetical protein